MDIHYCKDGEGITLGIDFDGTIVTHEFPDIGELLPLALDTLRDFNRLGIKLVLWTVRSGDVLNDAIELLEREGISFVGYNENPAQKSWSSSPKAYCNMYIDDAAFGAPLIYPEDGSRPYIDWKVVREQFNLDERLKSL